MTPENIAHIAACVANDIRIYSDNRMNIERVDEQDILNNPMNYTDHDVKIVSDAAAAIIGGCDLFTHSEFTDPRDNTTYKTIKVNGVELFAENVHYHEPDLPRAYVYINESWILYQRLIVDLVVPKDWSLLDTSLLDRVVSYFGGYTIAAKYLKDPEIGFNLQAHGFITESDCTHGHCAVSDSGKVAMLWGDGDTAIKITSFNNIIMFKSTFVMQCRYASVRCARLINSKN